MTAVGRVGRVGRSLAAPHHCMRYLLPIETSPLLTAIYIECRQVGNYKLLKKLLAAIASAERVARCGPTVINLVTYLLCKDVVPTPNREWVSTGSHAGIGSFWLND